MEEEKSEITPPEAPVALKRDSVEELFSQMEYLLQEGHEFNDRQRDIGIRLSLSCLPESEREWFLEIAREVNKIPLWMALWGQFRRCLEWGVANAPILDPGWISGSSVELTETECPICQVKFLPKVKGQRFCSNLHGALAERAATAERAKSEEAPGVAV